MMKPIYLLCSAWALIIALTIVIRHTVYTTSWGKLQLSAIGVWIALFTQLPASLQPYLLAPHGLLILHSLGLLRPRPEHAWYRTLISLPAMWFMAGSFLAIPWGLAAALGWYPYGWWVPFLLALVGVFQSLHNPDQDIALIIDRTPVGKLQRVDFAGRGEGRPLRIVQLTDFHVGPLMTVERLHGVCQRVVEKDPDLVLLTGDFVTLASHEAITELTEALAPLKALPGKVFACFGNHDHESPVTVQSVCANIGAALLVDQWRKVETPVGPIMLIGADFAEDGQEDHLRKLCGAMETQLSESDASLPRLMMLHDPDAFRYVPDGAVDLVFSGHTHGGQAGLVSFGHPLTVVQILTNVPDHGMWGKGTNRLYVHRGTSHYGFPARLGVPGEEGAMDIWFDRATSS